MSFGICALASSSSGNCYMIKTDNTALILDVGISLKRIKENLFLKNTELSDIDAVLITHEHSDHVKSLKTLMKKAENCHAYLSAGTLQGIKSSQSEIYTELMLAEGRNMLHKVEPGTFFTVGDIEVLPFRVAHDTIEPVAYSFRTREGIITVVTDTGVVTEEIYEALRDSDILVLEANHEPDILLYGSYPYPVKQRILSDYGHLSNEACARCLVRMLKDREKESEAQAGGNVRDGFGTGEHSSVPKVYLAHLSQENNTPEQARITVSNCLEEEGYYVGMHLELETLKKDEASPLIYV